MNEIIKQQSGLDYTHVFNAEYINASTDLPTPAGGIITIADSNKSYIFAANVNLGSDKIVVTGANVTFKGLASNTGITSTTTGVLIDVSGTFSCTGMVLTGMSASHLIRGIDASTDSLLVMLTALIGGPTTTLIHCEDYANFITHLCRFSAGGKALEFAGTVTDLAISSVRFDNIVNEMIDLGIAVGQSINIEGCSGVMLASSTFIKMAAGGANILGGGLGTVSTCKVNNTAGGTMTVGYSALDLKWAVLANSNIVTSDRITPGGWGFYVDDNSGGAQTIPNGVGNAVKFDVNGLDAQSNEDYLPPALKGQGNLWDVAANKLNAFVLGDSYDFRIQFTITGVSANPDRITCVLDIGGAAGITIGIAEDTKSITGTPQTMIFTFPYFTLATFVANGGQVFLYTDSGSADIEDRSVFIERISSGASS